MQEQNYTNKLERRIFSLYQNRLQAYLRLNRQNNIWNFCLIGSSAIILIISIIIYAKPESSKLNLDNINLVLIVSSLINLLLTSVLLYLNFSDRSRKMFQSYRIAQEISCELERINYYQDFEENKIKQLQDRYQSMLNDSENHTQADRAIVRKEVLKRQLDSLSSSKDKDGTNFTAHNSSTEDQFLSKKNLKGELRKLNFLYLSSRFLIEPLPIYIFAISFILTVAFVVDW